MDLSILKDSLSDFATLGKNLGPALQNIPTLLTNILNFFQNFGDLAETTGDNAGNLSS